MPCGVIASQFIQPLPPHFPLVGLTRADLAMLKSMRDDLEAQLANEESGSLLGRTYVAFFDGR